jgi:glycosyltransferase involved in cell wall biosynthesis
VLVLCKKNNPIAPFEFNYISPRVTLKDRSEFSEKELLKLATSFKPTYIFLCGWVYKPYLSVVKKIESKACVLGIDNQWSGTLRQRLGAIYFRLSLKPYVKGIFVPGPKQALLAKKLGFSDQNISQGAYCCDFDFFYKNYLENKLVKAEMFPKRFLFVGRYASEKGITDLWESFIELEAENSSDWELWCLGKGNIEAVQHPKIKHFGFLQPEQMGNIIKNTGVFILPSTFEPWGVVVHEYGSAGFPMLCSDKVGAVDTFLEQDQNGFIFEAGNKAALKTNLKRFMEMSDERLNLMSEKSVTISERLTPQIWADNLMRLYED